MENFDPIKDALVRLRIIDEEIHELVDTGTVSTGDVERIIVESIRLEMDIEDIKHDKERKLSR